ncbi:MAG: hypothetical protein ABIX01_14040 [Chitinophagaceae bacterium]
MKKLLTICTALILSTPGRAGAKDISIDKGTILVYSVKEGGKSYLYTVTVLDWDGTTTFSWQTNEKPKPRKGILKLDKYYSLGSDEFLVGVGKGGDEQREDKQSSIVAPSELTDYLLDEADDATFKIFEKGNEYTIETESADVTNLSNIPVKYDGVITMPEYTKIKSHNNPEISFITEHNSYKYILSAYKSETLTMTLVSVTSSVLKKTTDDILAALALPTKTTKKAVNMDAVKFAAVSKVYPLLSTVEHYDVTNGGKNPKPFSETYEFRQGSGAPNPPSAIDCFTADLQILYNQRKNYDLAGITSDLSKNNLPAAAAEMLMGVYLKKEARSIPGYKPWTHWKFVNSLTAAQRSQLAVELEGYIKQYGFTE